MIAIFTENGQLRITAEIPIPHAPKGQWSPARIGKLANLISEMVAAGEMVDEAEAAIAEAKRAAPVRPQHNGTNGHGAKGHINA